MNENVSTVRQRYPRATASSDYNETDCWTHIYDDHDEDGLGVGNVIGTGQFEDDAWADAAKQLEHQTTLATSSALILEDFDNLTLATANNAIQGFGRCDPEAMAYKPLLDANLIRENGHPHDLESLRTALAYEVNRRVKSGAFK